MHHEGLFDLAKGADHRKDILGWGRIAGLKRAIDKRQPKVATAFFLYKVMRRTRRPSQVKNRAHALRLEALKPLMGGLVRAVDPRRHLKEIGPDLAKHRMVEPEVVNMGATTVFGGREVGVIRRAQRAFPIGNPFEKAHAGKALRFGGGLARLAPM